MSYLKVKLSRDLTDDIRNGKKLRQNTMNILSDMLFRYRPLT